MEEQKNIQNSVSFCELEVTRPFVSDVDKFIGSGDLKFGYKSYPLIATDNEQLISCICIKFYILHKSRKKTESADATP